MLSNHRTPTIILLALVGALLVGGSPAQAARTRTASWPSAWASPLGGSSVTVTTNYGAFSLGCPNADRSHDYTWYLPSGKKQHLALDLAAAEGAAVSAIADGKVLAAGELWGAANKGIVVVEHVTTSAERVTAVYAHLKVGTSPRTSAAWRADDVVRRGERLGSITSAGTGPHLHFGVAPGTRPDITGTSGDTCRHDPRNTVDPIPHLSARRPVALTSSMVGWRNGNGSVTTWRVVSSNGLRRNWVPDPSTYHCLVRQGVVDWGPQPARFLDQLPDMHGRHARC